MNHLLKRSLSLIMAVLMVLAMIPANPVHVHAADEKAVVKSVSTGNGLSVMTDQGYNSDVKAYPVKAGRLFAVQLADMDAFTYGGYDGKVTVEVEYLTAGTVSGITVKEGFTLGYGASGTNVKPAEAPTYTKRGATEATKIAVYELSGAGLAGTYSGTAGVAVMLQNTTDAYIGIKSIKITKGIDNDPLTDTTESIESAYCSRVIPSAITITNTSDTFTKSLYVAATVTFNGKATDITNTTLKKGVPVAPGASETLVDFAEYAKYFSGYGTYNVKLTGYWNYNDAAHKINLNVTFERKNGHNPVAGAVTPPTCTEQGYTTYTCACGITSQSDKVSATGHTEVTDAAVAPSCTETGLTEGKHCSVCNAVIVAQTEVPATGHTEVTDAAVAPSCTETGLTEGKHCSACNAVIVAQTVVDATGHTKGEAATCTTAQTCTVCGAELVAALGHDRVQTNDKTHHWITCTRNCGLDEERAPHSFTYDANGNGTCVCGATDTINEIRVGTLAELQVALESESTLPIVVTQTIVIPKGEEITLNLNGKTVSTHIAEKLTKSFCMIQNKGTLTITDSVGTGKISVSYDGESFGYGVGLYAISNEGGVLTIAGGTVENLATVTGSMYDAIDNNSTLGETVLNITGGTVSCPSYIAIRQFANSTGAKNIVNVEGGTITGGNTSVWMQNPGSSNPLGELNITNGTVNGRLLLGSSSEFDAAVSGGTFDTDVSDFCAEDYKVKQNDDDTYSVIEMCLEGSGTAEDPYLISSVEDFIFFAKQTQNGNTYSGKIVKLANDIDFNGANFLEIAEDGTIVTDYRLSNFSGTFDGDNHTIKNFKFEVKCAYKGYIMMFSSDGGYEIIRNLKIENVTVNVADITGQTRITALANRLNVGGATGAAVENVHIKNYTINCNNTTSSDLRIGGFAYFAQGSKLVAENCSIEDFTVNANSATILGGAVSIVKSKCDFINVDVIDAKFNIGNMTNVAGGFAGQTQDNGTGTTFTNCDVDVEMTFGTIATDIGGFVASIGAASQFYNCTTSGSITVTGEANGKSIGGFVGDLGWNGMGAPNTQHEFNNCVADVDITAVNANVGGFIGDSTISGYPERFIPTYFNDCVAKGDVKTESGVAGGFVGRGDRGIFNDCSASGDVEGRIAGGFWGEIYPKAKAEFSGGWSYQNKEVTHTDADAKSIVLDSVAATGAVEGTEYKAGIIGFMKDVYVNADETLGYATPIVLKETPADYNRYEYPAKKYEVSTKAELNAALAEAQEGEIILLTADIDYGTDQLKIEKAITLDLGGKTLTTRNAWGGMIVTNNPTIKNGTIVHASNTAAIKVWNATAFEDLIIDVRGKGDANKTIGGIVLQSGSTTNVGSIKNVTIQGEALTNGIETYNCGDAAENVIGSLENVTIDAKGTGMLISAPVGTATNCSISGDVNGVEIWIKGNYNATLTLVDSSVEGGVYAHDEFSTNPTVVNNGTLKLTVDETTTGADAEDVTLTIARAEDVQGVLKDVMDNAQAKIGNTYYATLEAAVAAAAEGDTIVVLANVSDVAITADKTLTITSVDNVLLTNVSINGTAGKLTVSKLSFAANSWINAGGCDELVVENVTANVTPSNGTYTNSRSAFIGLGRNEAKQLKLTVTGCNIVTSRGTDAVLGWAAVTEVTIYGNTFGSETAYQINGDIVKFMAIADGAVFNITNNTAYSNYNGFVFAQNTTRNNSYTVNLSGNTFYGEADHIWVEITGGNTVNAVIEATSNNKVNGEAFTAADFKYHDVVIKNWNGYAGVDVVKDAEGKIIGGSFLLKPSDDLLAAGYEATKNAEGTYDVAVKTTVTIGSVEDLLAFANAVTNNTRYQGVKVAANPNAVVLLTADLDLTDSGFVGIGNGAANTFSGTFDGQNHTISNMTLSCNYYRGVGFFRSLGNGAVVKNVTFVNANVNNGAATGANHFYGVLAGFSNNLTVENVTIKDSTVTCKYSGAAMVGCLEGATVIKNSEVENVTLNTNDIRAAVYGIIGNSATGHSLTVENNTVKDVKLVIDGEMKTLAESVQYGSWSAGQDYAETTYVAQIGDKKYSTFVDAIAAAQNGETIVLIGDIQLIEGVVIPTDKSITLDLNGKTVSMVTAEDKATSLILNNGNLTIKDTAGNGKLSYQYTGTKSDDAFNTVETAPGSVLTVEGGTIENLSENCLIAYAIDGLTNGNGGDVTVNINGGNITSKKIAVRIFANSTTNTGYLNISGGEIFGRVILQSANASANKAALNITGGTFNTNGCKTDVLYVGGTSGATADFTASVSGGTFQGEVLSTINEGFISGGIFNNPVAEKFCATGFIPKDNGNGTYGVKAGTYVAEVNGTKYETLAEAIEAAQANDTVALLTDVAADVSIDKTLTLVVADKAYTGTISLAAGAVLTAPNGLNVVAAAEHCDVVYANGAYSVVVYVAQNVQTGKYYTSVNAGLLEAVSGQTVIMWADDSNAMTFIMEGVALDLNGYSFTSTHVVVFNGGNIVDNSASNAGRLVVESNKFMIDKNAQLPVLTETGYMFAKMSKFAEMWHPNTQDRYIAQFKIEATAHEFLKANLADTGVSIFIRVSWKNAAGLDRSQDFELPSAMLNEYLNSYNGKNYSKQIELKLTNVPAGIEMTYRTVVKAGNVEFTSNGVAHTISSTNP